MKDLTIGNEGKLIFNFALPMLIGNIFQQAYQIIDSIIVGHYLGKEALAAVGASFPIIFSLISLVLGTASGATILIAQFFGAKQIDQVKRTSDTLYIYLIVSAILLTVLGITFSKAIFHFMGLPENLMPGATDFLNYYMLGTVAFFGFNGTSAILRGLGDSKTPLYFLIGSTILNALLDLLFIPVLHFGIKGAALATVISQTLAFVSAVLYLNKTHKIIKFSIKDFVFDRWLFVKSIKVGLPAGLQQTFVALGMMALMGIVNGFGTDVIAAYSVVGRIDSFAMLPAMNFSLALTSFVGQNLGAGKSDRVKNGLIATMTMTTIIALIVSCVVFFFGDHLMQLFTNDANVIKKGHEYLKIVGFFYVAFNAMFTFGGVMRGAGDTIIPMFATLFSLWLIRVPLAYVLSGIFNEQGIWWAIPIAWITGAIFSGFYYRTGRWKKKMIIKNTNT